MLYNSSRGPIESDADSDASLTWWNSETMDNLCLKQKITTKKAEYLSFQYKDSKPSNVTMSKPLITISEDDAIDNIEMAKIESWHERILTPEGNVKYKNYRILVPATASIRMYSPSGDIHTSPKKRKIVPKYESFHDSLLPRDKLLTLVMPQHPASKELEEIIKPNGFTQRAMDIIRKTNRSCMEDRIEFLNSLVFTPSPTSLSMFSDDSALMEKLAPSPTPTPDAKINFQTFKSHSIAVEDVLLEPRRTFSRQVSVPCDGENPQMNLSDELRLAESDGIRSHTPRTMTAFEYSYFHRPISSLSFAPKQHKPCESKKSMLRNFVQRNMIDRSANRDKLAKLALAIEEDSDEDGSKSVFVTSARQMEERLADMLDETKELRELLVEIQDDLQESDRTVTNLLAETQLLVTELQTVNYLDDIISLLRGNLEEVAGRKNWPFAQSLSSRRRDPYVNLVV